MFIDTLSLEGSIAYAEARILENANHPDYVGHSLAARAGLARQLAGSVAADAVVARESRLPLLGKTFGRLENDDFNGDTYWRHLARKRVGRPRRVHDGRTAPRSRSASTTSPTIAAYQSHPYPSRTAFAEVRWSLGGAR
jgi:hypothetical protein